MSNKMKTKKSLLIIGFFLCFFFSNICSTHTILDHYRFKAYDGEGSFVEVPAEAGGMLGFVIAMPAYVIFVAPAQLCEACGAPKTSDTVFDCVSYSAIWPLGAILGGPSYLLKKTFWDGPQAICSYLTGNNTESDKQQKHDND